MTQKFHSYNIHRNVATHNDKDESHKYWEKEARQNRNPIWFHLHKVQTLYYIRLKLIVLKGQRLYLWGGVDGKGHQGMRGGFWESGNII